MIRGVRTPITPWSAADGRLSRLLHDFVRDGTASGPHPSSPPLTAWETEDRFHLLLDVPGVSEDSFEIEWLDGVLTITGRSTLGPPADARILRDERTHPEFRRVLRWPGDVDPAGIRATLEHGVLRVTLPKLPEARPRRIPVGRGELPDPTSD